MRIEPIWSSTEECWSRSRQSKQSHQFHIQQVYTYLRLGNYPVGLLLNFGANTMKAGIKRVVNGFQDS